MSLIISVSFADSVNGNTTDTFSLNDADAATFLSVLALANANQGHRQQLNPPLTYDALYHQIANNLWLGLQARVQNIQLAAAQTAAMASVQASVPVLVATAQANTVANAVKVGP